MLLCKIWICIFRRNSFLWWLLGIKFLSIFPASQKKCIFWARNVETAIFINKHHFMNKSGRWWKLCPIAPWPHTQLSQLYSISRHSGTMFGQLTILLVTLLFDGLFFILAIVSHSIFLPLFAKPFYNLPHLLEGKREGRSEIVLKACSWSAFRLSTEVPSLSPLFHCLVMHRRCLNIYSSLLAAFLR